MSYSFHLRAADKASAKEAVTAKVEEIVQQQPVHARDRDAILANAYAVIDLLVDDDTKDVLVSCNGYVSWSTPVKEGEISSELTSAAITANAGAVRRE